MPIKVSVDASSEATQQWPQRADSLQMWTVPLMAPKQCPGTDVDLLSSRVGWSSLAWAAGGASLTPLCAGLLPYPHSPQGLCIIWSEETELWREKLIYLFNTSSLYSIRRDTSEVVSSSLLLSNKLHRRVGECTFSLKCLKLFFLCFWATLIFYFEYLGWE